MKKLDLFTVKIDLTTTDEILNEFNKILDDHKNHTLFFINAHCYNIAQNNKAYNEELKRSDFVLNDGIGIKIAAKMLKRPILENMNGTDLIPKIIRLAHLRNKRIFLLGAKPGIAEKASENLKRDLPGLNIAGIRDGYFDHASQSHEVISEINKSKADVLILGMGVPIQELWLAKHKDELSTVKLSIAGGAIIDFISGNVLRAPLWIRKAGIEWLFRFIQEPLRLFKRYFIGNFTFFYYVIRNARRFKNNTFKHLNQFF